MDLVGPINLGTTGHVKHVSPTYILVITDPFSHMVWLECIAGKSAEEVFDKFVERFLLEIRPSSSDLWLLAGGYPSISIARRA